MVTFAVTALLAEPRPDLQELMDQLIKLVHDELRPIAHRRRSAEDGPRTLDTARSHRDLDHA